ncbi:hypothetical protein, conserved [Leishmania tarentolae]|uniref:Uncharacterized protein n=1 Tax=Leishmania tarentolae TaxID=5689 RepID=A0A640KD32_LEITA|nr:hypothetical protein, conserved [Leishmania tarentolae]
MYSLKTLSVTMWCLTLMRRSSVSMLSSSSLTFRAALRCTCSCCVSCSGGSGPTECFCAASESVCVGSWPSSVSGTLFSAVDGICVKTPRLLLLPLCSEMALCGCGRRPQRACGAKEGGG